MRILFWDIDGTLLKTGRASLHAFQYLAKEKYGKELDFTCIPTAGMTDCFISTQLLTMVLDRPPTEKECLEFLSWYEAILPEHLALHQGLLLPQIKENLLHFSTSKDFVSLLLTGNTTNGARAKLTHYGISQFFDFTASAFGDSCTDRSCLAAQALSLVNSRYPSLSSEHIFVIGDTPNDIACGKAIGAKTIAVATGRFALPELLAHKPWWAGEQLPPPAILEELLLK